MSVKTEMVSSLRGAALPPARLSPAPAADVSHTTLHVVYLENAA